MASQPTTKLTCAQIEAFATGLYHLAASDGLERSELDVIRNFLAEMGSSDLIERLPAMPFDPEKLANALDSKGLREVFLKAAIVVVQADGVISESERETLSWLASYLHVGTPLGELEAAVSAERL